jgi:hypothetical protein
MKNFIILIIQLCGYAFIFAAFLSFLNYMFGWHLGYKGAEVPAEPEFAIAFLVLGLITSTLGWFLNKKLSV